MHLIVINRATNRRDPNNGTERGTTTERTSESGKRYLLALVKVCYGLLVRTGRGTTTERI